MTDSYSDFGEAVARQIGAPLPLGSTFSDEIPRGKTGDEPAGREAKFWFDHRGRWVYNPTERDVFGRRTYSLAEVYAAAVSGWLRPIPGPQQAYWKLRALIELGFVRIKMIPAPRRSASAEGQAVLNGIWLMFSIRAALGGEVSAPFGRDFVVAWSGLSRGHPLDAHEKRRERIRTFLKKLADSEVLVRSGQTEGPQPAHLWAPGPRWAGGR